MASVRERATLLGSLRRGTWLGQFSSTRALCFMFTRPLLMQPGCQLWLPPHFHTFMLMGGTRAFPKMSGPVSQLTLLYPSTGFMKMTKLPSVHDQPRTIRMWLRVIRVHDLTNRLPARLTGHQAIGGLDLAKVLVPLGSFPLFQPRTLRCWVFNLLLQVRCSLLFVPRSRWPGAAGDERPGPFLCSTCAERRPPSHLRTVRSSKSFFVFSLFFCLLRIPRFGVARV